MLSKIISFCADAFRTKAFKPVPHVCGNCSLYQPPDGVNEGCCSVDIIEKNLLYNLSVKPSDQCFWEANNIELNQIRIWKDGTSNRIEYPNYEKTNLS